MAGFLAGLKDILAGDGETENRYIRLLSETSGTPSAAMLQSDVNRDVLPGRKSGWAKDLPTDEAAKLDRYAWGRQAGLGGVPVAAAYETLKAAGRSPALSGISGKLFGDVGREFFQQDETSSPASLGNVASYIRGATGADESGTSFPEKLKRLLIGRN